MALSVGVLAVAIPVTLAAIGDAGRTGGESAQENRSASILPACLDAIERSRNGDPGWFEPSPAGMPFPQEGGIWALAFTEEGNVLGRVTRTQYEQGIRQLNTGKAGYLVSLTANEQISTGPAKPLLRLTISIGYPAHQPLAQRKISLFHSSIR